MQNLPISEQVERIKEEHKKIGRRLDCLQTTRTKMAFCKACSTLLRAIGRHFSGEEVVMRDGTHEMPLAQGCVSAHIAAHRDVLNAIKAVRGKVTNVNGRNRRIVKNVADGLVQLLKKHGPEHDNALIVAMNAAAATVTEGAGTTTMRRRKFRPSVRRVKSPAARRDAARRETVHNPRPCLPCRHL